MWGWRLRPPVAPPLRTGAWGPVPSPLDAGEAARARAPSGLPPLWPRGPTARRGARPGVPGQEGGPRERPLEAVPRHCRPGAVATAAHRRLVAASWGRHSLFRTRASRGPLALLSDKGTVAPDRGRPRSPPTQRSCTGPPFCCVGAGRELLFRGDAHPARGRKPVDLRALLRRLGQTGGRCRGAMAEPAPIFAPATVLAPRTRTFTNDC